MLDYDLIFTKYDNVDLDDVDIIRLQQQSKIPKETSNTYDIDYGEIERKEVEKIVASMYKQKITQDLLNGKFKDKRIQKMYDFINPEDERPILWVTFNPDPKKMTLEIFKEKIQQVIMKKWIHKGWYSYELSNEGRLHVHMLIQKWSPKPPSHYKRELTNPFKEYIGNNKHIDIRKYLMNIYNEKLEYCKGNKWDKDKKEGVEKTKTFRTKNSLDEIYYFSK